MVDLHCSREIIEREGENCTAIWLFDNESMDIQHVHVSSRNI